MLNKIKLLFLAVIVFSALAAIVSSAQATNSFSIRPGGRITATSQGKLTFLSSFGTLECEVTLHGTLSSGGLIRLIEGLLMGEITEVSINRETGARKCEGGGVNRVLINEEGAAAWRIVFRKLKTVEGALTELGGLNTRAKRILILNVAFEVHVSGVDCLYGGNQEAEQALSFVAGSLVEGNPRRADFVTGLATSNENALEKRGGSFLCPSTARLRGTFTMSPQQTIIKRIPV
jgi:hypothetical protein